MKKHSPQRHRVRRDRRTFSIENSLLRVLRASAVQSPTTAIFLIDIRNGKLRVEAILFQLIFIQFNSEAGLPRN